MQFDQAKLTAAIETARAKAGNNRALQNGITRAAEGLKNLRAALKLVGFQTKTHFKVDPKFDAGYLWIRQFKSRAGEPDTIASARARLEMLADAMTMPREKFRERLEKFLRENGFEL